MDAVEAAKQRYESDRAEAKRKHTAEHIAAIEKFQELIPQFVDMVAAKKFADCFYAKWNDGDYAGIRMFDYSGGGYDGIPYYLLFGKDDAYEIIASDNMYPSYKDDDGTEISGELYDFSREGGRHTYSVVWAIKYLEKALGDQS